MTAENLGNGTLALAVVVFVIMRRMTWSHLDTKEIWGTPAILAAIGVYQMRELADRAIGVADVGFLVVGLVLAAVSGYVLGLATQVRQRDGRFEQRLGAAGVGIWIGFIGLRAGLAVAGHILGVQLTSGGGSILLTLGVNLFAMALVLAPKTGTPLPWHGAIR